VFDHHVVFGIDYYGSRHYGTWWWTMTVGNALDIKNRLLRISRWFRCRFSRRYRHHVIYTGLEPGWWDIDTIMLNGMFALLDRYVEWENDGPEKMRKWAAELRESEAANKDGMAVSYARQASVDEEAASLYEWWHVTRPAEQARRDWLLDRLYGHGRSWFEPAVNGFHEMKFRPFEGDEIALHEEMRALEEKMEEDEQRNLRRLIDIRRGLWT
jgi:hypothetical protein